MVYHKQIPPSVQQAVEAIDNQTLRNLTEIFDTTIALSIYNRIAATAATREKNTLFYNYFLRLRSDVVRILGDKYRQFFRIAITHPHVAGNNPDEWARNQLQPGISSAVEWIRRWYVLVCEGENHVWKSWRAPAWLFMPLQQFTGINRLKPEHVPADDSVQRLGAAHTRLILSGLRQALFRDLGAAIAIIRNEELAAAGAIPIQHVNAATRKHIKRKGWKDKEKLYIAIQNILRSHPHLEGIAFCAELDKRHAPPLYDWAKSGEWREGLTWKEAWGNPTLKPKIRRVRQEAQKHLTESLDRRK